MKPELFLHEIAGKGLEDLSDSERAHLEANPELKKSFLEQQEVAALMGLKRYELQDPAMEGRLIHRVSLRIQNNQLEMPMHQRIVPEWARMAAVVAIMLGLSALTHQQMMKQGSELPDAALGDREEKVAPTELAPMFTDSSWSPLESSPVFQPFQLQTTQEDEVWAGTPYMMNASLSGESGANVMTLNVFTNAVDQQSQLVPARYEPR